MDQKPSIGRIVHYHHETPVGLRKEPVMVLKTFPAIITDVKDSTALVQNEPGIAMMPTIEVGLQIFGCYYGQDPMPARESYPYSETPKAGHWSWPPRV